MLKTVIFLSFATVFIQESHQYNFSKSSESRLNHHDGLFQEIQEQEFILADDLETTDDDFSESSGDFEGSGRASEDSSDCVEVGSTVRCSNKGTCIDNKCVCNYVQFIIDDTTVDYRHSGRYCEECPYCRAQRCQQYLPCIECNLYRNNGDCSSYCQFRYELVQNVTRDVERDEKFCDVENNEGCYFKFKYYYDRENLVVVHYEKEMTCFNGLKFAIFIFWSGVIYVFALTLLVPRICSCHGKPKAGRSRTSLSRGYDVLRLNIFR